MFVIRVVEQRPIFAEVFIMSTDNLWIKFTQSGAVEDYLRYKDKLNDNTRRNRPERTSCGRTR